jgi:hypothetical protein
MIIGKLCSMKRLLLSFGLSLLFVGGWAVLVALAYGNAREQISPLLPGIWLSEYLVPRYGPCTSKEIPYSEELAIFYFFGTNIILYWFIGYVLVLWSRHRQKVDLP